MAIRVGINGFGRIGRKIVRLAALNPVFEIAGINDLGDIQTLAHLLKYDSVHGRLEESVSVEGKTLVVGRQRISCFAEKDPTKIPWTEAKTAIVHECTGVFTEREKAAQHLAQS